MVREGIILSVVIALEFIAGFFYINWLILVATVGYEIYLIFRYYWWAVRTLRGNDKSSLRSLTKVATGMLILFILFFMFTFPGVYSARRGLEPGGLIYLGLIGAFTCSSGIFIVLALTKLRQL